MEGLHGGMWVKSYLPEQKWLRDTCVTKTHPSMGDKSWRQPAGSSPDGRVSFPSDSVGLTPLWGSLAGLSFVPGSLAVLHIFKAAWRVSAPSKKLGLSKSDITVYTLLGEKGLVNSVGFRDFQELFLSCLFPILRSFPAGRSVSSSFKTVFLNLWVRTLSCTSDIYMVIHNTSKVTIMKQQQNNFMAGAHGSMGNVLEMLRPSALEHPMFRVSVNILCWPLLFRCSHTPDALTHPISSEAPLPGGRSSSWRKLLHNGGFL